MGYITTAKESHQVYLLLIKLDKSAICSSKIFINLKNLNTVFSFICENDVGVGLLK